ncbi:hypothetical protein [Burkholderia cepacia]|uniref:hypothetical protein n=1 Tax=Burkholderia cepacia TaxID=292 RepID=UPI00398E452A
MSEEQQNQPTSIVGEIVEGLHSLEQKVENFIHDAHAGDVSGAPINAAGHPAVGDGGGSFVDATPSSSEPNDNHQWTAEELAAIQSGGVAPIQINQIAEAGGAAAGELAGTAASLQPSDSLPLAAVGVQTSSEAPSADAPAVAASGESSPEAGGDAATTVQDAALPSGSDPLAAAKSDAATAGASDDPNAAASTAAASSESDTQSSASPASEVGVGLAIAASVSEAVASRVYTLRKHFWTFDEAARAPFIKLLDEIEALVK